METNRCTPHGATRPRSGCTPPAPRAGRRERCTGTPTSVMSRKPTRVRCSPWRQGTAVTPSPSSFSPMGSATRRSSRCRPERRRSSTPRGLPRGYIFISNRPGLVRPGSSGTPVTGYQAAIRDERGQPVADGVPGDLYLKAPSAALGYWCRTDTTRQVFQGEWLRTGDVYERSADGYYTCLGRTSDMIKAGGIWVSPAEVEARLLEHPDVAQAAVVGVSDDQGLEMPVACVVRAHADASVGAAELIAFCREGLAGFKRPRVIFFVETLPTTATGKLRRFAVRDTARQMLAAQS